MTGKELFYIAQAHFNGMLAGDGPFTKKCDQWIETHTGTKKALLTHSCTAALEMAAILADIQVGDEIIMPSYTFVSSANAFTLRGGVPVFVDIRPDTLNLDETKIEAAITSRTKAIVPVHYAGVGCEMDKIVEIADKFNLLVIEDAAQGVMSSYKNQSLGTIGHLGCFSFHETKNITSGEGGALLINDERFFKRAEIIREKGTNRTQFFRGEIDKYTWCDIGSSYLPGELTAAFLWAQMEEAHTITYRRLKIWEKYHAAFQCLYPQKVQLPYIPESCTNPNAHMYYLILPDLETRTQFILSLKKKNIHSVFHYIPLHLTPAGKKYAKTSGHLHHTEHLSERLVRLPLWVGLEDKQDEVIQAVYDFFSISVD
jgi:dTDP-4-amino-4,6-dideoxygalactose transaminase